MIGLCARFRESGFLSFPKHLMETLSRMTFVARMIGKVIRDVLRVSWRIVSWLEKPFRTNSKPGLPGPAFVRMLYASHTVIGIAHLTVYFLG